MRYAIVGVGRTGGNLVRQACDACHDVVVFDAVPERARELAREAGGPAVVDRLEQLADRLEPPRIVLLCLPAGAAIDETCRQLSVVLDEGDIIVDAGTSHWLKAPERAQMLGHERGIRFLDLGMGGGTTGAREGACFMVGGDADAYAAVRPILLDLAADERAVIHAGRAGSGHFSKVVHDAIASGMMQAIAEGVELMERSDNGIDTAAMLGAWAHGSSIRSWLVQVMAHELGEHGGLPALHVAPEDRAEQLRWVLDWALEREVPMPVASASQTQLLHYREADSIMARAVALMRDRADATPSHQPTSRS